MPKSTAAVATPAAAPALSAKETLSVEATSGKPDTPIADTMSDEARTALAIATAEAAMRGEDLPEAPTQGKKGKAAKATAKAEEPATTEEEAPAEEPEAEEEEAAAPEEEGEGEPQDLKARIFLRQKKLEQRQREQMAQEKAVFHQEVQRFQTERAAVVQEVQQARKVLDQFKRLQSGDPSAAAELGFRPEHWDALIKGTSPEFQQKRETNDMRTVIDELRAEIKSIRTERTASQQEQELSTLANQIVTEAQQMPTLAGRLDLNDAEDREVLFTRMARRKHSYTQEHGYEPTNSQLLNLIEADYRARYGKGDRGPVARDTGGPPTASNGTKRIPTLSASRFTGRESAPKPRSEMNEEELLAEAIAVAEEAARG